MHPSRWLDLPPELLHDIAGRLHHPTDFARFHAVCRPWRSSHEPISTRTKMTDQFLPWLLAPNKEADDSLDFRCVFSKTSYLAPPPPPLSGTGTGRRNWVASADGAAVCYFAAKSPYAPALCDALTGTAMTSLPFLPDGQWELEENPSGTIYDDGTVLLYTKHDSGDEDEDEDESETEFRAALLRPGDDEWTVVQRTLESPYPGEFCVAYHAGTILVTVERSLWHVLATTPPLSTSSSDDDFLVVMPSSMPLDPDGDSYKYSHVLESRGELLWASVHIDVDYPEKYRKGIRGLVRALSLSVHAFKESPNPRWVTKKGASLADRVLFLGWPSSFDVDASRLGGVTAGGHAYFVYHDDTGIKRRGVFRCNLVDNTTEFVEWLPTGWEDEMCTWLIPQPTVAPIHHGRRPATTPPRSNNMIGIERRHGPCFRVLVRNLPLSVNSTQLRLLFNKHGRVAEAEVLYYRKTKRSQGIGFLTMSTVHEHREDALDALNGLVFEGCRLQVVLVKEGRRRRRRSTGAQ